MLLLYRRVLLLIAIAYTNILGEFAGDLWQKSTISSQISGVFADDSEPASSLKRKASRVKHKRTKPGETGGYVPFSITYLLESSVPVPIYYPLPSVQTTPAFEASDTENVRGDRDLGVGNESERLSFNRMLAMGVSTVRALSDLELVRGRVFGQIFQEYTLVFFVLPRPIAVSETVVSNSTTTVDDTQSSTGTTNPDKNKFSRLSGSSFRSVAGAATLPSVASNVSLPSVSSNTSMPEPEKDTTDLDIYLDGFLASFFTPHTEFDLRERFSFPSVVAEVGTLWPLYCNKGKNKAKLPMVIFVCSRDHFNHPRSIPYAISTPTPNVSGVSSVESNPSLAVFVSKALEKGEILAEYSDGRPYWPSKKKYPESCGPWSITSDGFLLSPSKRSMQDGTGLLSQATESESSKTFKLFVNDIVLTLLGRPSLIRHESNHLPSHLVAALASPEEVTDSSSETDLNDMATSQAADADSSNIIVFDPNPVHGIFTDSLQICLRDFYRRSHLLHSRNFASGVYMNLVDDIAVNDDDWRHAVSVCSDFTAEVDISLLQLPSSHQGSNEKLADIYRRSSERLSKNFQALIHRRFRRVGDTSYYFYVPIQDGTEDAHLLEDREESDSDSEGDEAGDLPNPKEIEDEGSYPFFLRLECVVKSPSATVTLPATTSTALDKLDTRETYVRSELSTETMPERAASSPVSDFSLSTGNVILLLNCMSLCAEDDMEILDLPLPTASPSAYMTAGSNSEINASIHGIDDFSSRPDRIPPPRNVHWYWRYS